MSTVIKIENLWKEYRRGVIGQKYLIREVQSWVARVRGKEDPNTPLGNAHSGNGSDSEFWALKDISLVVEEGEVLGIIGRNGAGKSTLLKILSRVTAPTKGHVKIKGRVASLLEVGTGFHPELTGRENVFLNGAILGMTRAETKRKFDEIVGFTGIEHFIDTPVKRYSSGMYVRLAFAVAAHLDPEILVVDEVLAVGDAEFQKKCLGKMDQVAKAGRTVLFVSHQLPIVNKLCPRSILLEDGKIKSDDKTSLVIGNYLETVYRSESTALADRKDRSGTGIIRLISVTPQDGGGHAVGSFAGGQPARLLIKLENRASSGLTSVTLAIGIDGPSVGRLAYLSNEVTGDELDDIPVGSSKLVVEIPKLPFAAGRYTYTLCCSVKGVIADWIIDAGSLDVTSGNAFETGKQVPPSSLGSILIDHKFSKA